MTIGGVGIARSGFSWGRGLLHAAIPVAALLAAGLAAGLAGLVPSAEAAGMAVGFVSVPLFAGGFFASWLLQSGRRGCGLAGFVTVGLLAAAVAAGLLAFPLLMRLHPSALSAEDKTFPEVYLDGDGLRYRHPTLGFSLPAPTERFAEAPALAEQMRLGLAGVGAWAWAWEDGSTGERILVTLTKGPGGDREDFEDYCNGMKKALAGQEGIAVVRDAVEWRDGRGDYLLQTRVHDSAEFDTRCISGSAGRRRSYVACVMAVSARSTSWSSRFLAGIEAEEPVAAAE